MPFPPDIERVVSDSGALLVITGRPAVDNRFVALAFQFAAGTLHLRCDDDTDEVVLEVAEHDPGYPKVTNRALADLVDMSIQDVWELTNQRGYTDAFQLRLRANDGRTESRQFEVAASAMDVLTVS